MVLTACRRFVDLEFAAQLAAVRCEALPEDAPAAAVLRIGRPHRDKAAVVKDADARLVSAAAVALIAGGGGIDQESVAERPRAGVVDAAEYAVAVAVVAAAVVPHHHQVAVTPGGYVRHVLVARLRGGQPQCSADQQVCALRHTGVIEAAHEDVVATTCSARPDHRETAVVGGYGAVILGAAGRHRGHEVAACGLAIGRVTLADHAPAAAVGAVAVLPHHHEATVGEPCDLRVVLGACAYGIDPELVADRHTVGREALSIYPFP